MSGRGVDVGAGPCEGRQLWAHVVHARGVHLLQFVARKIEVRRFRGVVRDDGDDRLPTHAFGRSRERLHGVLDHDLLLAAQAVLPDGAGQRADDGDAAEQVCPEHIETADEEEDGGDGDPDRTHHHTIEEILRIARAAHVVGQSPPHRKRHENREDLERRIEHVIYPPKGSVDDIRGRSQVQIHYTPIRGYCQCTKTMAQLLLPCLLGAVRIDIGVVSCL